MASDDPPGAAELSPSPSSSTTTARLMGGCLVTHLLYVAVKLGVADALVERPSTAEAVAAVVGADPSALRRVLRGLAAEGVLDELPGGRFALTPLGDCLREGAVDSLRGAAVVRGDLYFRAADGLLEAVQDGDVAFEHAHGAELFDYLAERPDLSAAFHASMADRARQEVEDVVAAHDVSAFGRPFDVGGGSGVLLARLLAATPGRRNRLCGAGLP